MTKYTLHRFLESYNLLLNSKKTEKTDTLKMYFIGLFLLVFCQMTQAQLSVRNNAYVFVKDEIVFVEDDINLEETASTIYLRSEAQIIQGEGTTGNSGEGELSVYQDGNVGAYEYNYWCSPIGNKTDNNDNNPFGIQLFSDVDNLTESIPATYTHNTDYNGTASPLNIEPYWVYKFIAETSYYGWVDVGSNTTINAGEGFSMKGTSGTSANNPGDNQNYDFRGKPNTGQIAVTIGAGKYTLVGNPYPSAMDAHAYIWDANNKTTFDGILYYWEQDPDVNSHYIRDYDGGYTSYTISEDETTTTISPAVFSTANGDGSFNSISGTPRTGKTPERYIPIGQGFMVYGTADGTVNAENSHRVYEKESDGNSAFFKSANTKKTITEENSMFTSVSPNYKRFRLNIDFNNTYTRQLIETFAPTATEGFDRGLEISIETYDLLSSDAYWQNNNAVYVAEAIPHNEETKIPLAITIGNAMPISIGIVDVQNFEPDSPIFLHDKTTDLYVNLNSQDFSINLQPGTYTDRFEVTFKKATTLDTEAYEIKTLDAFQNNNTHILTVLNPSNLKIKSILVYDVSGKQVLTKKPNTTTNAYTLSTNNMSTGVYIVKAVLDNNTTFSKKVIIN